MKLYIFNKKNRQWLCITDSKTHHNFYFMIGTPRYHYNIDTVTTLNGLFKEMYSDKLVAAVTSGNYFINPVILGSEHGVYFNDNDFILHLK